MEKYGRKGIPYMEERYALLIDAENVSAKYIKPILDELSKYGNVTYKRIYGDWTNHRVRAGKKSCFKIVLRQFSSSVIHMERMLQIQQ